MKFLLAFIVAAAFGFAQIGAALASDAMLYFEAKGGYSANKISRELKIKKSLDFGDLVLGNNNFGMGSHSGNSVMGNFAIGFDFFHWFRVPIRLEWEYG
ncbi:MAG: hypothetical protein LBF41_07130, partial [Deltaproteobacteria bacterium]|nr:hypothetical protein [Deltaproteobacteria bacterium]